MGKRIKLGKDNYTRGKRAEGIFKRYALSLCGTRLVLKVEDDNSQKPADFVWVCEDYTMLVEVKSTTKYGNNIKNHQLVGMKKIQTEQDVPCYYAFVDVDTQEVSMVNVDRVIDSIRRGETEWKEK